MLELTPAIRAAVEAALAQRGYPGANVQLTPIEPPRDWGLSSNVCFTLASRAAAAEIEQATAGLDKKAAKALAAEITRAAGPKLAAELAEGLNSQADDGTLPFISRVEAEGAYLNFYFDPVALSGEVVRQVIVGEPLMAPAGGINAAPTAYGAGAPTGKRIMVEYAQPNTHKDFHVGHLRNASIGQAIANLLEFEGNEVKKATYIGDVGAHVAKFMIFPQLRDGEALREARVGNAQIDLLLRHEDELIPVELKSFNFPDDAYRRTNTILRIAEEADQQLQHIKQEIDRVAREWLGKWEAGDEESRLQWQVSRDYYLKKFKGIFRELQVEFDPDCWFYESTVDDTHLGQQTAAELKDRGIAIVDESEEYKGALYVDFEQQADSPVFRDDERKRIRKLGKMTILRSDGTSLYQTKELGLAKYKFDHFDIDESLYVVGSEQKLYFEQVFAILRLWGFPNAENCRHIAYELVVLPEGKMSSREGTVVSYRELRDEAVRRAEEITAEKLLAGRDAGPTFDVKQTAHDIAIAAIKYAMLQVGGNQQIVFDFEQALSFDGRAAPYLQYAYARAGKLVGDIGEQPFTSGTGAIAGDIRVDTSPGAHARAVEELDVIATGDGARATGIAPPHDLHPSEIALARQLAEWRAAARDAAQRYEPAVVCNYLYALAGAFNDFYRDCRVLDAPDEVKPWRQALTAAFRAVMKTGFKILALPLPEAM